MPVQYDSIQESNWFTYLILRFHDKIIIVYLKSLEIDGFRCLCEFILHFDQKITVVVGENDSGKTSLIDALNLFSGKYQLDIADFHKGKDKIRIKLTTDDFEFTKEYTKGEPIVDKFQMVASDSFKTSQLTLLSAFPSPTTPEDGEKIKTLAKRLGLQVRSNSNIDNLKTQLIQKLSSPSPIENGEFPDLNEIQLGGKQFEDPELFFKELFLKDKQNEIWNISTPGGKSIKEIIQTELDTYSETISSDLESRGIKEKLKRYVKNLTEIKVEPSFETRSLSISAKVKLMEGSEEILVAKKGDGTKRRISLALLEYKAETSISGLKLYILDEPDTHLHVKAQLELFGILNELGNKGNQIILTTHSPFLINAAKPNQIRLFYQKENHRTTARFIGNDSENLNRILSSLGIENIFLFFARKIILVEGDSEKEFLTQIYEKINQVSLNGDLIKIINVRGIKNIPGFATALTQLCDLNTIYVLVDNDVNEEIAELITQLSIPQNHQFKIGSKEFEDAFSDDVIYGVWKDYLESCGKDISKTLWTNDNIAKVRRSCASNQNEKFSDKLRTLNEGGSKAFDKILFARLLGSYCDESTTPEVIKKLVLELKAR